MSSQVKLHTDSNFAFPIVNIVDAQKIFEICLVDYWKKWNLYVVYLDDNMEVDSTLIGDVIINDLNQGF